MVAADWVIVALASKFAGTDPTEALLVSALDDVSDLGRGEWTGGDRALCMCQMISIHFGRCPSSEIA